MQMDSCGWIPISLIASFNRVRQLTVDEQLVKDVLILSSMVEVLHDSVRMIGWEQFVLPDAVKSTVGIPTSETEAEEEEEEEEVVFVMGREAGWSADPEVS
jgi:la-related protein 1